MCPPSDTQAAPNARFLTTQWNLVFAAAQSHTRGANAALAELCRNYWMPLYAFARRQGHSPETTKDLVQGFFASLLANRTYLNAQPGRGKFRSFLIGGLKHYLQGERDRANALKRGGGVTIIPLDNEIAETKYNAVSSDFSPEKIYERHWARSVIDNVLASLRAEFDEAGKKKTFEVLAPFLSGDATASYDECAAALGLTLPAFKTQLHRMRMKFRAQLRREIASTVSDPLEIDEELAYLRSVLSQ